MAEETKDQFKNQFRLFAKYNRWFNGRLYEACRKMSDEERKADRGAFFKSVHLTLNHLLWGDRRWINRFLNQGTSFKSVTPEFLAVPAGSTFGSNIQDDFEMLWKEREELDIAIEALIAEMPSEFFLQTISYPMSSGVRTHPAWEAMSQVFNHQTHHRGQITTLLSQAGIDVGPTDMLAVMSPPVSPPVKGPTA